MLDINFIRDNSDQVKKATKAKNLNPSIVDSLLKVDGERRKILGEVEALRAKRNKLTKDDIAQGKKLKIELNEKEDSLKVVEKDFFELIYKIPRVRNTGPMKVHKFFNSTEFIRNSFLKSLPKVKSVNQYPGCFCSFKIRGVYGFYNRTGCVREKDR